MSDAVPPPPGQAAAGLAALLQYEAELRRKASVPELCYFVANDSRAILPYAQMFILRQKLAGEGFRVEHVSSLAAVDRQAPLIHAIEQRVAKGLAVAGEAQSLDLAPADADDALAEYPNHHALWQPLLDAAGQPFAGLLVTAAQPFPADAAPRLARIAETMAHGWRALTGGKPVRQWRRIGPRERRGLLVLAAVVLLFPVRLSVLAPFEAVAERPYVLAAPANGVIERMHLPPNAAVRAGQLVLTMEDLALRGQVQEAEERVRVAGARLDRATSAAFADEEEAASLATLRAEQEVAQAELAQLRDLVQRTQLRAPRGGMLLYSDRRDWEGRAVTVGEPIVQIADPARVVVRVDLPVREQIALQPGGQARLWLDAEPLWARDGRIVSASFQARETAERVYAYAVIVAPDGAPPRIGSRGTAKLYGRWVPLSYAMLRRPIAALRQFVGL